MNSNLILGLALVLSGGLFGCSAVSRQTASEPDLARTTSITRNVVLEVSVPAGVKFGQPVVLTIRLTNKSKTIIYYARMDGYKDFGIIIRDSHGALPTLTPSGKNELGPDGKDDHGDSRFEIHPIQPLQFLEWQRSLNYFYLLKQGNYTISTSMDILDGVTGLTRFKISSKPLKFVVQ
ncbi:MAG TPA: hypothetical protein VK742_13700 [Candidatus Sulfotelmatobacter sp.]|jgi:hypothetical protein|nr:hypothetical protein [Candidatus Sulfotelmatobacter sp.]